MAIRTRNKISAEFSTASMSDLVFLLLIFFMLTSTLVSPNAVKLLLPSSNSQTMAGRQKVTVYIDENFTFYVDETPTAPNSLESSLRNKLIGETEASVVLRSDNTVPVQYVVDVIDAVNKINGSDQSRQTKHKVILATKSR